MSAINISVPRNIFVKSDQFAFIRVCRSVDGHPCVVAVVFRIINVAVAVIVGCDLYQDTFCCVEIISAHSVAAEVRKVPEIELVCSRRIRIHVDRVCIGVVNLEFRVSAVNIHGGLELNTAVETSACAVSKDIAPACMVHRRHIFMCRSDNPFTAVCCRVGNMPVVKGRIFRGACCVWNVSALLDPGLRSGSGIKHQAVCACR